MMRVEVPFEDWVVGVFDPTVEDPWPPPAQDLAHLHLSEQGGRLEMICSMFWDVACFGGPAGQREGNLFEDAVLDVLEDTLQFPHAACQESAVHGLGHRISRHPERAPAIPAGGLKTGPVRHPRLRGYAEAARTGCSQ